MGARGEPANRAETLMQSSLSAENILPSALTQSGDFEALSPEQRRGFMGRLLDAHELVDASLHGSKVAGEVLRQTLLDLELDAMTFIGVGDPPEKAVSAWTVHSSWTFECSDCRLGDYVDPTVFVAAEALQVTLDASQAQVSEWLRQWAAALQATFAKLSGAKLFCEAIAQLIAIDMLVASLLMKISLLHISGYLNRR
jgi:hypothetical protein